MKIAIIETGGKQYLVEPGKNIEVEKLAGKPGDKIEFTPLLYKEEVGGGVEIGRPYVEEKKITGEIIGHKRRKKITNLRYHSKTRHRRKVGHRQHITLVKITSV